MRIHLCHLACFFFDGNRIMSLVVNAMTKRPLLAQA